MCVCVTGRVCGVFVEFPRAHRFKILVGTHGQSRRDLRRCMWCQTGHAHTHAHTRAHTQVYVVQKMIIEKCNKAGKPVITGTTHTHTQQTNTHAYTGATHTHTHTQVPRTHTQHVHGYTNSLTLNRPACMHACMQGMHACMQGMHACPIHM